MDVAVAQLNTECLKIQFPKLFCSQGQHDLTVLQERPQQDRGKQAKKRLKECQVARKKHEKTIGHCSNHHHWPSNTSFTQLTDTIPGAFVGKTSMLLPLYGDLTLQYFTIIIE